MNLIKLCLSSLLLLAILHSCADAPADKSQAVPATVQEVSPPPPVVAQVEDSIYTLPRLQAWLDSQPDTLSRSRIERHLLDWIEAQIFVAEANRRDLGDSPLVHEELASIQSRYLRGLLLEEELQEPVEISSRELGRWYRRNQERFKVDEEQLKFSWYWAADSLEAASLLRAATLNRITADQLGRDSVRYGKTEFMTRYETDPQWADEIFALEYLAISRLFARDGGYLFFQVVGRRPAGYVPPLNAAGYEVEQAMRDELLLERQRRFESKLRNEQEYLLELAPLYESEGRALAP